MTTQISAQLFESRYEKIRVFLEEQNLGALFAYSPPLAHQWGQTGHVSYLSGWANHDRIVDSAVVVPLAGRAVLLVAGMPFMLQQAAHVSTLEDVRLVQAVDPNAVAMAVPTGGLVRTGPRDFAAETLAILEENGLSQKEVGIVGLENMTIPLHEALSRGLGRKFRRVEDIVAELRSIKSATDIEMMRQAACLSDLGFETMLEVARPNMRGIEIIAEMERVVRRKGADHAKYWMASGPPTHWSETRLDLKPHERVLGEGDLMAACSYVLYRGYWCHGQRTGTLVRPSGSLENLCAITRQAQDAGLAKLRAGVPIGEVARAIREEAAEHNLELQGGRIGHGIGMDYSERPAPLTESNRSLLQAGMTVVIHATYSLPGSGKMFVPLGDVCHVTANGPELLMKFPRTSFLAGQP